ncbi:MAG TPA: hypothetical protein VFM60_03820, partial [Salinimicrobium sp.]|nr:hypothetical protein [Salinimicrobium sp.]
MKNLKNDHRKNLGKLSWKKFIDPRPGQMLLFISLSVLLFSCQKESVYPLEEVNLTVNMNQPSGPFEFSSPVYDIASTPDGSIMLGLNDGPSKKIQIIKNGK